MNRNRLSVPVSIMLAGKAMFKFSGVEAPSRLTVGLYISTVFLAILGLRYLSRLS